jgi:hypothetical protein
MCFYPDAGCGTGVVSDASAQYAWCLKKTSTGIIHYQTKNNTAGTCHSVIWLVAAYGYCGNLNLPCARAESVVPHITMAAESPANANTGDIIHRLFRQISW